MHILAVDDDESILKVLDHALSFSGNEVTTALSAKEAMTAISRADGRFDCLLIDIQMPDVDGIQLTEVIRQMPGYARPPVLMLTAMHEKVYLDRAFQAGATDYLTKPFDFKNLQSRIFDAHSLAYDKSLSIDFVSGPQHITWTRGVAKDTHLAQAIAPVKIDGLIAYSEFDNYVLELARRPKYKAIALAVKMTTPTLQHAETTLEEFSTMLGELVTSTSAALSKRRGFFSYRGNGTLLCVTEQNSAILRESIEHEINAHFASISAQVDGARVRVFLGDPTPIRTGSDAMVFESLWFATDSVERRFAATKQIIISRLILNQSLMSEEQHRLKQKTYKSIMREMLSDIESEYQHKNFFRKIRLQKG